MTNPWGVTLPGFRMMLLATHVGGEPTSAGHGAPVRLVAPDRRGFQWVKWVDRIAILPAVPSLAILGEGATRQAQS